MGVPLLPLMASAVVHFVFRNEDGFWTRVADILWSPEIPFFTAVLGGTTAFQNFSLCSLLTARMHKHRNSKKSAIVQKVKVLDELHTKLYITWAVLSFIVLVDVLALGGFYYYRDTSLPCVSPPGTSPPGAARPSWSAVWMAGEIVMALTVALVGRLVRPVVVAAKNHLAP